MNICPPAMNIAGGFSIDKVKYVCYNEFALIDEVYIEVFCFNWKVSYING